MTSTEADSLPGLPFPPTKSNAAQARSLTEHVYRSKAERQVSFPRVVSHYRQLSGRPAMRPISSPMLYSRLASFFQCRPVGRVLERLVVFRERVLSTSLLDQHVAPILERVGPVRPMPVRLFELC